MDKPRLITAVALQRIDQAAFQLPLRAEGDTPGDDRSRSNQRGAKGTAMTPSWKLACKTISRFSLTRRRGAIGLTAPTGGNRFQGGETTARRMAISSDPLLNSACVATGFGVPTRHRSSRRRAFPGS